MVILADRMGLIIRTYVYTSLTGIVTLNAWTIVAAKHSNHEVYSQESHTSLFLKTSIIGVFIAVHVATVLLACYLVYWRIQDNKKLKKTN